MWNNVSVPRQTKEYCLDVFVETGLYYNVFNVRDATERIRSIFQNVRAMIYADTGNNLYLLASEAVERALSLKKVLDEYNNSLLVPICFSWIVVGPYGCDPTIWEGVHKKPQGNCGILIHPDIEWLRELEGFAISRLESGLLCLEQRFFSVENPEGEITLVTEPIVLVLDFNSKEAKDNFRIPETTVSFLDLESQVELYVERLDCSLISRALNEGATRYVVWREQEIALFNDGNKFRRIGRFEGIVHPPNIIPKCCLPYCDLLNLLPTASSPADRKKDEAS